MNSFATALIGKTLGGYKISRLIGEGGMAVVLSAENVLDPRIRRALKVIKPEYALRAQFYERFAREALVLEQLKSEHILEFHGLRRSHELLYMELELLEGFSLDQIPHHQQKPSLKTIIGWLHQAALGLAESHKNNILHRDIKPANLYIHKDHTLKLLDFGIAKVIDDLDKSQHSTLQGHVLGSPAFMAPEVCEGKESTPQADIYGLGLIGYQLILGHHPFVKKDNHLNTMQVMLTHLQSELPSLDFFTKDCPRLERVLSTAASKDPRLRYRNGTEFALALEHVLNHQQSVHNEVDESIRLFGEFAQREAINWMSPFLTFALLLVAIFSFQHEWHTSSTPVQRSIVLPPDVQRQYIVPHLSATESLTQERAAPPSAKELLKQLNIVWISITDQSAYPRSISKTEITVSQYRLCVEADACHKIPDHFQPAYGQCSSQQDDDSLPINCITFAEAKRFAQWVNRLYMSLNDSQDSQSDRTIVRLPSFEDWQAAIKPNLRPWGTESPTCERSIFFERAPSCKGYLGPQPVCSRPSGNNHNGACDLFGNVWEWVMPTAISSQSSVLPQTVGGGWSSAAIDLRIDGIKMRPGHIRNPSVGVRLLYLH